jgi:hypothetical protein
LLFGDIVVGDFKVIEAIDGEIISICGSDGVEAK